MGEAAYAYEIGIAFGVHNNSMYGRPALRAARCASRTSFGA